MPYGNDSYPDLSKGKGALPLQGSSGNSENMDKIETKLAELNENMVQLLEVNKGMARLLGQMAISLENMERSGGGGATFG